MLYMYVLVHVCNCLYLTISTCICTCILIQGEAYSDPVKLRRQRRLVEAKKNIGGSWAPSSGSKQP